MCGFLLSIGYILTEYGEALFITNYLLIPKYLINKKPIQENKNDGEKEQ